MSGKDINFDDKKIKKSNFYKKEKLFIIDVLIKFLSLDVNKINF